MSEVYFYHLTHSSLEQALPDLLDKVRSNKWRALVRGRNKQMLNALDKSLWMNREDSFLPHGVAGGKHDAMQPVLLTDDVDNKNKSEILLLVDGAKTDPQEVARFKRVCLMFDGNNQSQLQEARVDWKSLTSAQVPAQYWAQEDGRWVKKAEKKAG